MKMNSWGFDVRDLEPGIRPQDDFFHHVNRRWMDKNPVPAAEARWGTFMKLRYDVEKQVAAIVKDLEGRRNLTPGSPEQMIRDLYRSGMDLKRRTALGAKPLTPYLTKIRALKDTDQLVALLADFERTGGPGIWGAGVQQDAKDSTKYRLHLAQDGLGMPDREYYLKDDAESVRVRDAYKAHVARMFGLLGYAKKDAERARDTVLEIETVLARASMKKEDMRDPERMYHKMTVPKLRTIAPNIDWDAYLTRIKTPALRELIVMQPEFLKETSRLFSSVPLAVWKTYLEFHLANEFAPALSPSFMRQSFSFYGTVLVGTKAMKPLWRRVLGAVNSALGEQLGRVYVERHFPPEAKKKMDMLVDDLFVAFTARLKSLDWMTPATKRKALLKLRAFNRKIGYPKKWKSYRGLRIDPTDYVGNLIRSNEYEHKRAMKKLAGPIDRDEWFMDPQVVNAYFEPTMNDIAFPAAILQPPFFSLTADDAVNYGSIGAVIGHEITHGFDDEGSKYDAKGNLKSWWTPEDRKRFEAKAKKVERQFDRYEVADGLPVNGKLTLGENIADLGGLSIAYDAYQLQLTRTGRRDIDGLTPEQRFFTSFAVFERETARPEFQKMQVLNDPHSPGIFRINGPMSNFDAFYDAYGVKKGDRLYRSPGDREMVW